MCKARGWASLELACVLSQVTRSRLFVPRLGYFPVLSETTNVATDMTPRATDTCTETRTHLSPQLSALVIFSAQANETQKTLLMT